MEIELREHVKIEKEKLENLLDTLNIDLFEDETFVICGGMKSYNLKDGTYKKGIRELRKEFKENLPNLTSDEIEEVKKKVYKLSKQRIGNKLYKYEDAIEKVVSGFACCIGLWIPKGYIVVDADDLETSNTILNFIKEKELDTPIIQTPHGYQFIFKHEGDAIQSVKAEIGLGVKVDYRCAGKGYIVLPFNTPHRAVYNNNGNVEYIYHKLLPVEEEKAIKPKEIQQKNTSSKPKKNKVASKEPTPVFEEGSRNDSLYRFLCGYVNNTQLRNYDILLMFAKGVNLEKCNPPLNTEEVETIVKNVIENYTPPAYLNDKGKIIHYRLAETIVNDYNCISDKMSSYIYDENSYKEVPMDYYKIIDKYISDKELMKSAMVKEVTSQIYSQTYRGTIENSRSHINFKNGLFNIKTRELEPHSKDIVTLGTINGEYDPKLTDITGTNFEKYLTSSLSAELIPVVQEMLGVCLYPLTDKIHYFYILTGEGRNGKGVLLDIILNMIPKNLRSGITMADYDTRFANASIKGKQINICTDDRTTRLEGIGNLKSVTAGEGIYVERKGVDGEMIKAILTHISAFNVLPSLQEKSTALFDRMIIIPFKRTFGTAEEVARGEKDAVRDVNLKTNIIENELDIVVNWALEGLLRVIDNGYKFTITDAIKNTMEEYREEVDSVRAWIKAGVTPLTGPISNIRNSEFIRDTELLNWYRDFCEDEGITPVGKTKFKQGLQRVLGKYLKSIHNYKCYAVRKASITDIIDTPVASPTQSNFSDMIEVTDDDCPF